MPATTRSSSPRSHASHNAASGAVLMEDNGQHIRYDERSGMYYFQDPTTGAIYPVVPVTDEEAGVMAATGTVRSVSSDGTTPMGTGAAAHRDPVADGRSPPHHHHSANSPEGGSPDRGLRFIHGGKVCTYKGNIFDKLTDPALYTGHHKYRFDAKTGKGKGIAGRESHSITASALRLGRQDQKAKLRSQEEGHGEATTDRDGHLWSSTLRAQVHCSTGFDQLVKDGHRVAHFRNTSKLGDEPPTPPHSSVPPSNSSSRRKPFAGESPMSTAAHHDVPTRSTPKTPRQVHQYPQPYPHHQQQHPISPTPHSSSSANYYNGMSTPVPRTPKVSSVAPSSVVETSVRLDANGDVQPPTPHFYTHPAPPAPTRIEAATNTTPVLEILREQAAERRLARERERVLDELYDNHDRSYQPHATTPSRTMPTRDTPTRPPPRSYLPVDESMLEPMEGSVSPQRASYTVHGGTTPPQQAVATPHQSKMATPHQSALRVPSAQHGAVSTPMSVHAQQQSRTPSHMDRGHHTANQPTPRGGTPMMATYQPPSGHQTPINRSLQPHTSTPNHNDGGMRHGSYRPPTEQEAQHYASQSPPMPSNRQYADGTHPHYIQSPEVVRQPSYHQPSPSQAERIPSRRPEEAPMYHPNNQHAHPAYYDDQPPMEEEVRRQPSYRPADVPPNNSHYGGGGGGGAVSAQAFVGNAYPSNSNPYAGITGATANHLHTNANDYDRTHSFQPRVVDSDEEMY